MEVNGMQRIVFINTELDKSFFPLQKFIHLPYLFVSLQFCIYYCAFDILNALNSDPYALVKCLQGKT